MKSCFVNFSNCYFFIHSKGQIPFHPSMDNWIFMGNSFHIYFFISFDIFLDDITFHPCKDDWKLMDNFIHFHSHDISILFVTFI